MTTITIVSENRSATTPAYRAIAGDKETSGKTAGEALDAITDQLDQPAALTLIILQHFQPDSFFTAQQQERLAELMTRWREALQAGKSLPNEEQTELEALVQTEIRAATARAKALADGLLP